MKVTNNFLLPTLFLSAGALSFPTTNSDFDAPSLLSARGTHYGLHDGYIGMYDNDKCTGNGIKNGHRPKINIKNKCVKFIHNEKDNGTFPYVKVDYGVGIWTVPYLKVFGDTECKDYIGVFKHPKKANTLCVKRMDYGGEIGWGSVMSVVDT